ncbi:hypothetical protein O181_096886 [Austropuccinia psidii MF-1]|uniref:Uncharacterized protein n=1 Tax=Austropuccinia psidii MF-1 TaxID=1389203 RepID=A0A9Q3J7Y2_9BASI|nr:hypothetical protein [Austropuccinia psidii MF-1]
MSPVNFRDLGFPRNQPEDRTGLFISRRPGFVKKIREIIPTLLSTFQFNRQLKPEECKDMDQVLQLHKLLQDLFPLDMENKRFSLASNWEELGEGFQKIFLKEISFKELMKITKGWNIKRILNS